MSFQDIRRRQIQEILDMDKSISRKVFDMEFKNVKESEDVYKAPSSLDKMVQFQVVRYVDKIAIELTATFDELNNAINTNSDVNISSGKAVEKWNEFTNYLKNYIKVNTISERQRDEIYQLLEDKVYPPLNDIINLFLESRESNPNINIDGSDGEDLRIMLEKIVNKNLSPIKYTEAYREYALRERNNYEGFSLDELTRLYQDLLTRKEFETDGARLNEINKQISDILKDERAVEFPQLYGQGRANMLKAKYSKVKNMGFDDSRNDFYKK